MKGQLRTCENTQGAGGGAWAGEPLPTHKQAPLTLIRCLLTHLVKVFFCTRSRSSAGDKTSLATAWEKPGEASLQRCSRHSGLC